MTAAIEDDASQESAINIFRIKMIATLDSKEELLLKRQAEIQNVKDKTIEKAQKMLTIGGDVATVTESVIEEIQQLEAKATKYLKEACSTKLSELRVRAKAATTKDELARIRVDLGIEWKLLNKDAVEGFTTYVKHLNVTISSMGRKTSSKADKKKRCYRSLCSTAVRVAD